MSGCKQIRLQFRDCMILSGVGSPGMLWLARILELKPERRTLAKMLVLQNLLSEGM